MDLPNSLICDIIDRGVILHSTMFDYIDHGKFFVIIGVSNNDVAGFFFINSDINNAIKPKQEQLNMQYPMKKSDYSFLHHDSFLCATRILKLSKNQILESISKNITTIKGNMKREHLDELLECARESKLFSAHEKERFLY